MIRGTPRSGPAARVAPVVLLALLAVPVAQAPAQPPCRGETHPVVDRPTAWEPPLNRRVSVRARGEPLRQVLDGISRASGVRISYSGDVVPVDRPVCLEAPEAFLGDALRRLVGDAAIDLVPVGPAHVVLSPARAAAFPAGPAVDLVRLEPVVVRSAAGQLSRMHGSHGVTVIGRDRLERFGGRPLDRALNALVPGFAGWMASPANGRGGAGSLRGAGPFGRTPPRVYLDGIEIASPWLLADLAVDAVERVEVVSGPQAAALYGAGAIGGVVSIVSRRAAHEPGAPRSEWRSSAAVGRSGAGVGDGLVQRHALTYQGGGAVDAARVTVAAGGEGALALPGENAFLSGMASGRWVSASSVFTGIARLHLHGDGPRQFAERLEAPRIDHDPAAPGGPGLWLGRPPTMQYTLGTTWSLSQDERWTHTAVAGLDGYRVRGDARNPSPSGLAAGAGSVDAEGMDRVTLLFRSSLELPWRDGIGTSFGFTAEQRLTRRLADAVPLPSDPQPALPRGREDGGAWQGASGVSTRADVTFGEALHLTGGAFVEGNGPDGRVVVQPQIGASVAARGNGSTLKLRASLGRTTAPSGASAPADGFAERLPADHRPEPETQAGVEVGATLLLGRSVGLEVMRFSRTASNLGQSIPFEPGAVNPYASPVVHRVSEVSSRGWEVQAGFSFGEASLVVSGAAVDTRAARLGAGYAGELRPGDRMLEVPARTAGMMGTWNAGAWDFLLSLNRAWDWIGYDRARLGADLDLRGGAGGELPAPGLREYWMEQPGILTADASVGVKPHPHLEVRFTLDNLLEDGGGAAVLPPSSAGRQIGMEVRVRF